MASYRLYKNGLYAKKYKGYFIVPPKDNTKKVWTVMDLDKVVVIENIPSLYDAFWEVDKLAADEEELLAMYQLYQKTLQELEILMAELTFEKTHNGLSEAEVKVMDYAAKILDRKRNGKEMGDTYDERRKNTAAGE